MSNEKMTEFLGLGETGATGPTGLGAVQSALYSSQSNTDQILPPNSSIVFPEPSFSVGDEIQYVSPTQIKIFTQGSYELQGLVSAVYSEYISVKFQWFDATNGVYVGTPGYGVTSPIARSGDLPQFLAVNVNASVIVSPVEETIYEFRVLQTPVIILSGDASLNVTKIAGYVPSLVGATGIPGNATNTGATGPAGGGTGATGPAGGGTGATGATGANALSSSVFNYRANTSTIIGDPTNAHVLWNNAIQNASTQLSISNIDDNGNDIYVLLKNISGVITLQDKNNAANYQEFNVNGAVVSQTGYVDVPVYRSFSNDWVKVATPATFDNIASSSDGTKLCACKNSGYGVGYIYTSTDSGNTWVEQTSSGSRAWIAIASSADGTQLCACDGSYGYIYTSTDSGNTWIEQTSSGSRGWQGIASSADGTKLCACAGGEYIYTSTDNGNTWIQQTSSGSRGWQGIASSADGVKLCAITFDGSNGYIYTSTDSGNTWIEQPSSGSMGWKGIASSADGARLCACESNGYVYISTNSGVNWTPQTIIGIRQWSGITCSSDGEKIYAIESSYLWSGVQTFSSNYEFTNEQELILYISASGIVGEKGPTGPQGIPGMASNTGATGTKGEIGETGATGPAGQIQTALLVSSANSNSPTIPANTAFPAMSIIQNQIGAEIIALNSTQIQVQPLGTYALSGYLPYGVLMSAGNKDGKYQWYNVTSDQYVGMKGYSTLAAGSVSNGTTTAYVSPSVVSIYEFRNISMNAVTLSSTTTAVTVQCWKVAGYVPALNGSTGGPGPTGP